MANQAIFNIEYLVYKLHEGSVRGVQPRIVISRKEPYNVHKCVFEVDPESLRFCLRLRLRYTDHV